MDDYYERRKRVVDRVMNRCVTALKVALVNMDDAIDDVKDDWLLYETLMEHRSRLYEGREGALRAHDRAHRPEPPPGLDPREGQQAPGAIRSRSGRGH